MNKEQAARLLGISQRTLATMMKAGVVTYSKGTNHWDPVDFSYSDLGLKEPEIPAIAATETNEPEADDAIAPPETAPASTEMPEAEFLAALNLWSKEALEAARLEWMKPACPGGPCTNVPDDNSGTMPSPRMWARVLAANSILQKRALIGARPYRIPRRAVLVDEECKRHNNLVASLGVSEESPHW
jgi:hypothetical protein